MTQVMTTKDLVQLPDYFLFKIIVNTHEIDHAYLLKLTAEELDRDLGSPEISTRPSRNANYLAHTLRIYIESYEEIERLYTAYRKIEGVLMVL